MKFSVLFFTIFLKRSDDQVLQNLIIDRIELKIEILHLKIQNK